MIGRLEAWWFAPAPAARLAILRVVVGLYGVYLLWSNAGAYQAVARQPVSRFAPVGPVALLSEPLDPALFDLWLWGTFGLLILFVLGVAHRVLAPLLAASLCAFLAYRTSWGKVYHSDNLFTLQLMVLAVTPAASALSVDAWVARCFPQVRALSWLRWPETPGPVDARFGWPIRLICAVTTLTYFLAGMAKVGGEAGWAWATGHNLLAQIGKNAIQKELLTDEGVSLTVLLAYRFRDWLGPLAVLSLALEILAPLALLERRLGRLWCFGTWCMHLGIHVLMDILFLYPATGIAFLAFFEPDRWLRLSPGGDPRTAPSTSPRPPPRPAG